MKTHNLTNAILLSLAAARDAQGDTPTPTKTVKVRFLEGYNSREVRDFNFHSTPAEHRLMAYLLGASPTAEELANAHFLDGYTIEEINDNDLYEPSAQVPLKMLRRYIASQSLPPETLRRYIQSQSLPPHLIRRQIESLSSPRRKKCG